MVEESIDGFLHGILSASYTPSYKDSVYNAFCDKIKKIYSKYVQNGKLIISMFIQCIIGKVEGLI